MIKFHNINVMNKSDFHHTNDFSTKMAPLKYSKLSIYLSFQFLFIFLHFIAYSTTVHTNLTHIRNETNLIKLLSPDYVPIRILFFFADAFKIFFILFIPIFSSFFIIDYVSVDKFLSLFQNVSNMQ